LNQYVVAWTWTLISEEKLAKDSGPIDPDRKCRSLTRMAKILSHLPEKVEADMQKVFGHALVI
jgi:hypothetical protein